MREGLPAQITLRSSVKGAVTGTVARVDPTSDSVTEERIAQVTFASVPAGLSTGEMAEVIVRLPTVSGALLIPNAALRQLGAHSGVWVHEDGALRFVSVTTGAEGQDGSGGLQPARPGRRQPNQGRVGACTKRFESTS